MENNKKIKKLSENIIKEHISEHIEISNAMFPIVNIIEKSAEIIIRALKNNKTIFWCGNGGSSSDSQHLAGELIGRFVGNRMALRSISLASDSAVLTCIANDFGYDEIFSRQLEGLGQEGDVLIAISTSGQSRNVINVCKKAKDMKIKSIGFLGKDGGEVIKNVDQAILIPSKSTARIQEMHIMTGHILCDLIEEGLGIKNINET